MLNLYARKGILAEYVMMLSRKEVYLHMKETKAETTKERGLFSFFLTGFIDPLQDAFSLFHFTHIIDEKDLAGELEIVFSVFPF